MLGYVNDENNFVQLRMCEKKLICYRFLLVLICPLCQTYYLLIFGCNSLNIFATYNLK